MTHEESSQRFLNEARAQKRALVKSLKIMGISWFLLIILTMYVRYAEKGAVSTHIAALVAMACLVVGVWSIFSVFHEWRLYRDQYGYLLGEAEDR